MPQIALADCAHEIVAQAYTGSVTRHYSQGCYAAAIRIEPVDGSSYSDLDAIIKDAKRADALRVAVAATDARRASTRNEQHAPPPGTTRSRSRRSTHRAPPPSPPTMLAAGGRNRPAAAERLSASPPPTQVSETLLGAPPGTPLLGHLAPAHAAMCRSR